MKLQDAIDSIHKRQDEARRMEADQKEAAVGAILPVIQILQDSFDDLCGWDHPVYCAGVAQYRCWMEGRYGSVYMNVDSRTPEKVDVFRSDNELAVATFPTTEDGLSFMVMAVAERMVLCFGSEMNTATLV